jgi:predicted Ser/Thr protein kinase
MSVQLLTKNEFTEFFIMLGKEIDPPTIKTLPLFPIVTPLYEKENEESIIQFEPLSDE